MSPGLESLPGLHNITRVTLPNGITVIARANFNSPSVVVTGYLHIGCMYDPPDKLGLADFTSAALMDGTQSRTRNELYDALESIGAGLGFDASTHTGGFSGRALAEDLDMLLEMIAEVIRMPAFPEDHLERLRTQLMTGLALREENTDAMAALAMDQILYPNHPYGRPAEGYPETVETITQEDILDFHRKYYGPKHFVLAIVGGVDPQVAVEKVTRALGDWQNDAQPDPAPLPPLASLSKTITRRIPIQGKQQADIYIGTHGPLRKEPGYLAAALGNNIFGRFGMGGRIGEQVREKAGLAYSAGSSLTSGIGPGPWFIHAGVNPANIDKALAMIQDEIVRFVADGVTEEELADSKSNFIGRLPLTLESNGGVAGALLNLERYELGMDYFQTYAERVNKIAGNDVFNIVERYLNPDALAVAIAGPLGGV